MSDQHEPTVNDSVDQTDQQPGERLDADKLPEEFPDRPLSSLDHGTTEREMEEGQSLDQRLARETPDADVGTPLDTTASTPLIDDADDQGKDSEKDLVADQSLTEPVDDSGQPDVPTSAENQAMHVVDKDDVPGAVDHRAVRPDEGSS